uniref:Uncharacterized protein n=1 Tax=Anguilla anguilla TaxID=7936 RepID=A0A0E9QVM0_ANGAN
MILTLVLSFLCGI